MSAPRLAAVLLAAVLASGCSSSASPPGADLPPAYPRGQINDPKLAEAARGFASWATARQADGQPLYARVETPPPVETVLPYGIGAYQKEPRLPALLTTGPGWDALTPAAREEEAAAAFRELAARANGHKVTLTLQTPEGLVLAWVNELTPGRKLLHGQD
jgi:hypothetical protein